MDGFEDILNKINDYNEKNMDEVEREIRDKRKTAMIDVYDSWGHEYAGYGGIFVTTKKELYVYQYYFRKPSFMNGETNWIKFKRILTDDEFNQVTKMIEEKILPFEFEYHRIYDASYDIIINYNGIKKEIENHMDISKIFRETDK